MRANAPARMPVARAASQPWVPLLAWLAVQQIHCSGRPDAGVDAAADAVIEAGDVPADDGDVTRDAGADAAQDVPDGQDVWVDTGPPPA